MQNLDAKTKDRSHHKRTTPAERADKGWDPKDHAGDAMVDFFRDDTGHPIESASFAEADGTVTATVGKESWTWRDWPYCSWQRNEAA